MTRLKLIKKSFYNRIMKIIISILLFNLLLLPVKAQEYDFFDDSYKNYREAAKFLNENPSSDKRISWSENCFYFGKKKFTFKDYTKYNSDGFKKIVLTQSANNSVKLVFYESNGCRGMNDTYFKVFYKNKEKYDSRTDFFKGRKHLKDRRIYLNINFYIDKDLNKNGKDELFIDVGYAFGMPWNETYYLFEYDDKTIKLIRKIRSSNWEERLSLSDHFKKKFKVSDAVLSNIIIENFNEKNFISNILDFIF